MLSKKYIKLDQISHVIKRPDMYIGSIKCKTSEEYIAKNIEDGKYIIKKEVINTNPGLTRLFIEALSNSIDNWERSKITSTKCTEIRINVDKETGETKISNNGLFIPVELNDDENCYNHSLIFGQLLTGENYDDEKERTVSGKNGIGIKAVNIFSTKFIVRGVDPVNKKVLIQEWNNNMRNVSEPIVTSSKLINGYTEVTWFPDFDKFEMNGYSDEIINLFLKLALDTAMLTKISVYFNNKKINIKSLEEYAMLYENIKPDECLTITYNNSDVILSSSNEFSAISFVNGIYTKDNGVHVDAWIETLLRPIVEKFNKKKTSPQITIRDVKQFFRLFVVVTVDKPCFESQSKNKLESPSVDTDVQKKHILKISKWSSIVNIENVLKSKEMNMLKKTEKKKKFVKIDDFDPANLAGTKHSKDCCLILCEGLSAKTYAVAGIKKGLYGKSGRDYMGILPLLGKILNTRNSTAGMISKNTVITNLIQAIGLKYNLDYSQEKNFNTLNYGKVILLTDADTDGLHIEGLILNFFHSLFPSLLERDDPYVVSMKTPIIRIIGGPKQKDKLFYEERSFKEYMEKNQTKRKVNAKYYKGLGTTRPEDVSDTFGLKMLEYKIDDEVDITMQKIFHKKYTNERKNWLENYDPENCEFNLDAEGEICDIPISNFLNKHFIKFSFADCKRSLPCLLDGLKNSQRKILYCVRKRKLKYSGQSLKVAQLAGYTAEHSNYHHGEMNLFDTIIGMANEFVGTNNIPLLYRDGMFGSRYSNAEDAANARYIFTKMEALTEFLFREEDDPLLEYVNDDGDIVEPKYYIPILPTVLINGVTCGIGTGWSCNIPCYNPKDILKCVREWIENDGNIYKEDESGDEICILDHLTPWYRDFTGEISRIDNKKFISYGCIKKGNLSKNKIVTEIPVGMSIKKFKEICENLLEKKSIKELKNYSSPNIPNFIITETDDFTCDIDSLKLYSYIHTSNMVLFDKNEKITKYEHVEHIIDDFCKIRMEYYVKRKLNMLYNLETELKFLENKHKFISDIVNEKLDIMKQEEDHVIELLKEKGYSSNPKKIDGEGSYDYLLRLQVRNLTSTKIDELYKEIEKYKSEFEYVKNTSEKQMWLKDLIEFEMEYDKWIIQMSNNQKDVVKTGIVSKNTKKK